MNDPHTLENAPLCRLPVLSDWRALVPCLTADIAGGLPQVETRDLATLTACCVEAAVGAEATAAAAGDAVATGAPAAGVPAQLQVL